MAMKPSALEDERPVPKQRLNEAEVMSTKAPIVLPLLLAFVIFLLVGAGFQHVPEPAQNTSVTASQANPQPPVEAQLSLVPGCDSDC